MKTKLVTSYYAYHAGEPYWGQLNRERWYKYSLACICGMGVDTVCYTDKGDKGFDQIDEIKKLFNLTNLTIKVFDMADNPYQEAIYKIRTSDREKYDSQSVPRYYTRSPQIYWMKYTFLEQEYEPDINLYWIDAGLSHHGLFPPNASKYSKDPGYAKQYPDEGGYMPNEYKFYWYNEAFTPEVLNRINDFAKGKIINLYRETSDDNMPEFREKLNIDVASDGVYPIAGFFGGKSDLVLDYIRESKQVINQVLSVGDFICNEQEIMGYINATHRDWFTNWKFDTFYHEGWEGIYKPEMVSFSHFFLKPLNN